MADKDQVVVNIEMESRHGIKYLVVRAMKREMTDGRLDNHPLNASHSAFSDTAAVASLELSGSFTNDRLIGFAPLYYDVTFIDFSRSKSMMATLAKIHRELVKAEAREPGDVFMAFCKAIGAKSVAVCVTPEGHPDRAWLPRCQWRWDTVESGRDRLRNLIAEQTKQAA
jgi:hypothetical protein